MIVRGIIDQLSMDEAGALLITEWKTRRSPTAPAQGQQRGTALQLMLYRHLLRSMRCELTGEPA